MLTKWIVALILFSFVGVSMAQTPTLTPTPPINVDDYFQYNATAGAQVNDLPSDISMQGGTSLIPDADATQLFSYARWLFSFNTANELLGKTLAPIGINLFVVLTITVAVALVWFIVKIVVLLIKIGTWLFNQVLKLIPFW